MRKIRIFFVVFFLLIDLPAAAMQTLRESVHQAMMLYPEILLNRAQTSAAQQGINEAKGAYYPKFDINSANGTEWSKSPFTIDLAGDTTTTLQRQELNVALIQNIYSGGAIVGEVKRNMFVFKSQEYKTYGVMNEIALGVTQSYLDVLLQRQLVRVAEKNLSEHRRLLNLIRQRSLAGVARSAELDQAESRYSLAEANVISSQGNLQEAMVHFRKLVGSWPDDLVTPIVPHDDVLPRTLDDAVREGFDNHPLIKSAGEDIKQAQAQRKISNAAFLPKVDAVFTASQNRNLDGIPGPNDDRVGLIRVSYNLFKGGTDVGHLKKTAYQVRESLEARDKAMVELKEKLQLDYNAWYVSRKRVVVLASYVVNIEKTRVAYFEQFQIGQRTLLDLLNSQNETYRSQVDYLQSNKDEIEARYRILNGVGRLVPYFIKEKDCDAYQPPLFSLPKGQKLVVKTTPVGSLSTTSLGGQMIYPTGNTRIAPLDATMSTDVYQGLKSTIPSIISTAPVDSIRGPNAQPVEYKVEFLIELNGFKNQKGADDLVGVLLQKSYQAKAVLDKNTGLNVYNVLVGPFGSAFEAHKALDAISQTEKISGSVRQMTAEDNLSEKKNK